MAGHVESRGQTGQLPTHPPSSFCSTGWEDPHPLDSPRSHPVPEVHLSQRRVELWHRHVGGDVVRGAALLGHDQSGRKSSGKSVSVQPDGEREDPHSWPFADLPESGSTVSEILGKGSSQPVMADSHVCTGSRTLQGLRSRKVHHLQISKSRGCIHLVASPE